MFFTRAEVPPVRGGHGELFRSEGRTVSERVFG